MMRPRKYLPMLGVMALAAFAAAFAQTPASQKVVGHFARPDILESSGVVASRMQPGVYWTMNDSGGPAIVYAFDLAGRDLGAWRVAGATNQDWESLSIGRCRSGSSDCLYIGETGDNGEKRPNRRLYRISEPAVSASLPPGWTGDSATAERLDYVYPDGPHDDEAIYVAPNGATWFITKGRSKRFLLFHIDPGRWGRAGVVTAKAAGELKLSTKGLDLVTDAGLSPNGAMLAVRTYRTLFVLRADPKTGEPDQSLAPAACGLAALKEAQGEGVAWQSDGQRQVLTSEGAAGQISVIACPAPKPPKP